MVGEEKSMRIIDGDAFRRELDHHWPFTREEQSKHGMADFAKSTVLMVLNQMPTIEERKTGKWIRTRTMKHDGELYCDQCEQEHPEQKKIWNYCPNCGASMMEGEQP